MVMSSYQTLYESSIAFGMRKALLADQKKRELQARVSGGHRIGL
jgi:dynein light intermediate chain